MNVISPDTIILSTIQQLDSHFRGDLLQHLQASSEVEATTRLAGYFNFKFTIFNGFKIFPLEQESVEILRRFFKEVNQRILLQDNNQPSAQSDQNIQQFHGTTNTSEHQQTHQVWEPTIILDLEASDDSDVRMYMNQEAKTTQKAPSLRLPTNDELKTQTIQKVLILQQSLKQPTIIPKIQQEESTIKTRSCLPPRYEEVLKQIESITKKKKRKTQPAEFPSRKLIKNQEQHETIFKETRRHRWTEKMAKIISMVQLQDFFPEPTPSDLDELRKKEQFLDEKHHHQNIKELHVFVQQTTLKSPYFHVELFANHIQSKPPLKQRFNRESFLQLFLNHEETLETNQFQKQIEDIVYRETEINQTRCVRIVKEFMYEQIFKSFAGAIDKYIKGWSTQILMQNRVEMNRIQQMTSCKPTDFQVDGNYETPIQKFIWRDSLNQIVIYLRILAMNQTINKKERISCQEIFTIVQCLMILVEGFKLNGIILTILKDRYEEMQRNKFLQKSEKPV